MIERERARERKRQIERQIEKKRGRDGLQGRLILLSYSFLTPIKQLSGRGRRENKSAM